MVEHDFSPCASKRVAKRAHSKRGAFQPRRTRSQSSRSRRRGNISGRSSSGRRWHACPSSTHRAWPTRRGPMLPLAAPPRRSSTRWRRRQLGACTTSSLRSWPTRRGPSPPLALPPRRSSTRLWRRQHGACATSAHRTWPTWRGPSPPLALPPRCSSTRLRRRQHGACASQSSGPGQHGVGLRHRWPRRTGAL